MLYSTFISKLRLELKDTDKIGRDRWDGDGSSTIFQTNHFPIKDASYTIKVGSTTKTETTDYAIDKDLGIITFVVASDAGSDNVEITYRYQKLRDTDYVELVNDGIDQFRWKFWREAEDTSTFTTVKAQNNYDLSSLTGILYLIHAWYKTSSSDTSWSEIQGLTNWKYLTRQSKLFIDPPFDANSLPMKLRYLKSFTKGTLSTDTLDIPDEWLLPFKYYIYARFYERFIPERISETAAVTTLPSYAPSQVIFNIAESYYRKAEEVANRIAPKLPSMPIKQLHEGVTL